MQSGGDLEMEIDRSTTWLLARCDKDGNYKSDKIQTIAEEIVSACLPNNWMLSIFMFHL